MLSKKRHIHKAHGYAAIARLLGGALLLFLLFALAPAGRALAGSSWNSPGANLLDGMLRSQMNQQMLNDGKTVHEALVPSAAPPGPGAAAVPRLALSATDFAPRKTRLVPGRMADQTPGLDAGQRRELVRFYENLMAEYERTNRRHNVASAIAYLVAAGAFVLSDGQQIDPAVQQTIARQINDMLGAAPNFARMPAAQRQEMYESAVIAAGYSANLFVAGRQQADWGQVQTAKQIAHSAVTQFFGRPPEQIAITADGLVFR